jgi:hypothetical protein
MNEPTIAAPLAANLLLSLFLAACAAARAGCNLVLTTVNASFWDMETSALSIAGQKTSSALRAPSPRPWRRENSYGIFPSPPFVEKVPGGRMRSFRDNERHDVIRDRSAIIAVTPAKAGAQLNRARRSGVPAFAGMPTDNFPIRTGTFPLRLKPEDWTSGDINWLLDVIAPSAKLTSSVLANFGKVRPFLNL